MNCFIELVNSLKRGVVSPVYLFYGEETYLQEQAVSRLKQYLVQGGEGESDLNCDLIDGETATPACIAARAEMLPFAAKKRLVVVKGPAFFKPAKRTAGGKPAKEGEKNLPGKDAPLLDYINNPLSSTCLVFTTSEPVDKRKRLFQAIKKNGRVLEFAFLGRRELAYWLAQRARAAGKRFAAGADAALLDAAGPSMQRLAVELEKIINYTAGKELITRKDVCEICPPVPEENIFAIVDAVGNRRCGEALNGIKELLAAREPPLKILSMISRQFRLLLQVHELLGRGCPAGEIISRLKLHPYVYKKIATQSKNFGKARLVNAVMSLSELDLAVKTGRQEFYPAVEMFLLRICTGGGSESEKNEKR